MCWSCYIVPVPYERWHQQAATSAAWKKQDLDTQKSLASSCMRWRPWGCCWRCSSGRSWQIPCINWDLGLAGGKKLLTPCYFKPEQYGETSCVKRKYSQKHLCLTLHLPFFRNIVISGDVFPHTTVNNCPNSDIITIFWAKLWFHTIVFFFPILFSCLELLQHQQQMSAFTISIKGK